MLTRSQAIVALVPGAAEAVARLRQEFLALAVEDRILVAAEISWTDPDAFWVLNAFDADPGPFGVHALPLMEGKLAGLPRGLAFGIEKAGFGVKRRIVELRRRLKAEGRLVLPSVSKEAA